MENKKNKKILARVGAMVAAVLLVALCALPAFADDEVNLGKWTYLDINEAIIDEYDLQETDPAYLLLTDPRFNPEQYPVIVQFKPAEVGGYLPLYTLQNLKMSEYAESGIAVVHNELNDSYTYYDDCYITSTYTTTGENRFVYLDIMANNPRDDDPYQYTRALRIRYKQSVADGAIIDVECSGDITGDASGLVIAFMGGELNAKNIEYAISRELVFVDKDVNIRWWNFARGLLYGESQGYENGFNTGKDYGYSIGYDEGMNQTSLLQGVTAIFRAPMELIDGVLNFELFGINMAMAVRTLITMAIIGVCVTIVWKAVK